MKTIAFVGAGQMGQGMLASLARNGFAVTVHDISPANLAQAVSAGATAAGSLSEAVEASDVVVTMLPTAAAVEQVYLGATGILAHAKPGTLCIDMTTVPPALSISLSQALAERHIRFLDSPVSGGGPRARSGTLTLMVGGGARDFEDALPVLQAMGSEIVHVGPAGGGSAAKIANNVIAAASMVATSEAFQIARAYGVDPVTLTKIFETSSSNTWVLHNMHPVPGVRAGSPSSRNYEPGFTTDLMIEVLELIQRTANDGRVPLTLVPAMHQLWQLASNHGFGSKDCTSVYEFIGIGADKAAGGSA
ncbi:MAG TPA: NAD(P)-dependent oxidoreductase [Bosea sp. (in: a-proteobacteria)]|jgi:3-hydroxyisobutyrate dehydrogenase|nr:NAD(P)-dependent oxidoreductase [Bosea sp. (in: a-proteobacteria)]